CQRTYDTPYSF
nr:immunoglobulin light chain junction region [Macaca mulatta]